MKDIISIGMLVVPMAVCLYYSMFDNDLSFPINFVFWAFFFIAFCVGIGILWAK